MYQKTLLPAALAFALLLSVPALGQAAKEAAAPAANAPAVTSAPVAPKVDQDKAYLLRQEFVAKTAELHGKITAREAELETLLATKPGDEAAIKKLAAEISGLRGQLFEQKTLYRLRFAKETGTPIRETHHMMGGMMGGMQGGMMGSGMDCKMMGKGMGMGMGKGMGMMQGMDHGAMSGMDHGAMSGMDQANMPGMDHPNMPGMDPNMPGMSHPGMPDMTAPAAKGAPAGKP
ncbi:MAG: hypothetical protein ACLGQH_13410 [Acidobacteriota bacterium]